MNTIRGFAVGSNGRVLVRQLHIDALSRMLCGVTRLIGWFGRAAAAAFVFSLVMIGIGPADARNHALMVAVTQYDEQSIRPLEGPNNDVILMWRELRRRGFAPSDMTVLADGLPKRDDVPPVSASPTRAAILDALKTLAGAVQSGDFVVFQFSGHGSTQPVANPAAQIEPEPDGRDQVLLPRDAGRFDPALRSIRNAIVDDELALALDAIRIKGATVWAIIDACHAGTVTRSGAAAVVTRSVRSATLGVPDGPGAMPPEPAPVRRSGTFVARPSTDKAPLIGFYAVDSRTEAIERPFPKFAPGMVGRPDDERLGVFTAHLVRAMESGKAATFRDLARTVARDITKSPGTSNAPLPVFDGDLDRPIGGGEAVPAVRYHATLTESGLSIGAGTLHGFEPDAVVAVFQGPLPDAGKLGIARVADATAATSTASFGAPASLKSGAEVFVEVEEPAVSFAVRIARPELPAGADADRVASLMDQATASAGPGRPKLAAELVAASEPADVRLSVEQGRIWAVFDGQALQTDLARPGASISVDLALRDDAVAGNLRRVLWGMARAVNLLRLAAVSPDGDGDGVAVTVEITRERDSARTTDERRACAPLSKPDAPQGLTPSVPAAVGHCDMFTVSLQNSGGRDLDVGVFYLDARAGIALVDERMSNNGCVVTLPAAMAEPMRLPTRQFAVWDRGRPQTLGLQRLLVFAFPRTGSTPPSLCHLRAPSIEAATRSAGAPRGLARLLRDAALADGVAKRSANPAAVQDEAGEHGVVVRQFTFDLRSREAR